LSRVIFSARLMDSNFKDSSFISSSFMIEFSFFYLQMEVMRISWSVCC
jgi:hypothetical protein